MSPEKFPTPSPETPLPSAKELSLRDFSFSADDVLNNLRSKHLKYIGTAQSDFQSQPLLFDESGEPKVMSDWEFEIVKALNGKKVATFSKDSVADLPRFFDKTDKYVDTSAEMSMNMMRISLDMARLCPSPKEFDEKMMSKYVKALALIKASGQEPMLALYHWTMPKYLLGINANGDIDAGGWENPEANEHFKSYIQHVVGFLGDEGKVNKALDEEGFSKQDRERFLADGLAKYFLTINEPSTFMNNSYMAGVFPPYKKYNLGTVKKITQKLIEAHDMAYKELKNGKLQHINTKVGLAHNWTYFDGLLGKYLQETQNEALTRKFEKDGGMSDFLGLQYYCRVNMTSPYNPITKLQSPFKVYGDHPDFGDIYPPGIYEHLKAMNQMYPKKEIIITEFGFSDARDKKRPLWILETVRYILEAQKAGIPIKGMLLWSLVNNFEWDRGMDQKFGLFSEKELDSPRTPSSENDIRSWEVWQSVARSLADPTPENLAQLQAVYEKAKQTYTKAGY